MRQTQVQGKILWDVHSWHPAENRAEDGVYVLNPQATLPSSLQQLLDVFPLLPCPCCSKVTNQGIKLQMQAALLVRPPELKPCSAISAASASKLRKCNKEKPFQIVAIISADFLPNPVSNRVLRDAVRSGFTHPTVAAGLLRSIYLERPTCSIQASEYCLSPTECNANTTVWWHVALMLEIKVNRMWKYLQSSDHYYENLLINWLFILSWWIW